MKKFLSLFVITVICLTAMAAAPAVSVAKDAYFGDDDYQIISSIEQAQNAASAQDLKIKAKSALLMDYNSGTVIYSQNQAQKLAIASMTKIMTLLLTYEHIEKENLSFDKEIIVSNNASSMGGSQAFLEQNAPYKLGDLIKSVTIASANDACVALAELVSGTEDAFVELMNQRAKELRMDNTHFANCTGLPAVDAYSCAMDCAIMMRELIKHPQYFLFSTIWMEDIVHPQGRVTGLTNTNKLVRFYDGCDGGKTGFTSEALHCLTATAKRNGMRLISVVIGCNDSKTRFAESSTMLNYGFNAFENKLILSQNNVLEHSVKLRGGKTEKVLLTAKEDCYIFGKKGANKDLNFEFELPDEVKAPVEKGQLIGKYKVIKGGEVIAQFDIVAAEAVGKANFVDYFKNIINKWHIGSTAKAENNG